MQFQVIAVLASAGLLLSGAALAQNVPPKRVQCWTDNQGHRACGDAVPSQYVQKERQIFDDQGRIRAVKPREKTAAEVAAEEQAARDAADAAQKAQKQRDYDHFLLGTYNSDTDIEHARDERVAMLDGRQKLAEKSVADNQKAIEQQQARIDTVTRNGKTPGKALTDKLDELNKSLTDNRQALASFTSEKQQVSDKYNADLARYRQLRSAPPASGSPQ